MGLAKNQISTVSKPDIYTYTDLHLFLVDWFEYLASTVKGFSLRKLSLQSGVNHSILSKLLNNHVSFTAKMYNKVSPHLKLTQEELAFLASLRSLSESKTQNERVAAFKKILRHKKFKTKNHTGLVQHEFLSNWYYPVIHELAKLPSFQWDAKWIRKHLNNKVTLTDIKSALVFLSQNGYIAKDKNGEVQVNAKQITCSSGLYRLAASEYHDQLLGIARDSIYDVERELRQIMSHTVAMPTDSIHEVRDILRRAVTEIRDLSANDKVKNSVYQISLLAFPVTSVIEEGGEDA